MLGSEVPFSVSWKEPVVLSQGDGMLMPAVVNQLIGA
jgi:hypothetical protein